MQRHAYTIGLVTERTAESKPPVESFENNNRMITVGCNA